MEGIGEVIEFEGIGGGFGGYEGLNVKGGGLYVEWWEWG